MAGTWDTPWRVGDRGSFVERSRALQPGHHAQKSRQLSRQGTVKSQHTQIGRGRVAGAGWQTNPLYVGDQHSAAGRTMSRRCLAASRLLDCDVRTKQGQAVAGIGTCLTNRRCQRSLASQKRRCDSANFVAVPRNFMQQGNFRLSSHHGFKAHLRER